MMRITRTLIATLLLGLFLMNGSPLAHAQATTTTTTFKDVTITFQGMSLCNPDNTGTATFTFNGVLHTTLLDDGTYHIAGQMVGTIVAIPDNPMYPILTGRVVQRFSPDTPMNLNQQNRTATWLARVRVTGSDGSTEQFTVVERLTVNANGEVTVSLGDIHGLRCG